MLVILLSGVAIAVSLPVIVLGCECLLALLPLRRDRRADRGDRPRLVVVVPAHNEAAGVARTIEAVLPQLDETDRLLVVADNCDDRTAAVAASAGATVIERFDDQRRGKGYAVRFALEHLKADPPEVVVSVDADCLVLPGCIERIARAAHASGHPMQAAYTMPAPKAASAGTLISAFAVIVKNYVRPRGLQQLRMPCLITGSGVAYPWDVLQKVPHPESHIVEDMHYSVDLALAGTPPLPCMEAAVEAQLPDARDAARTQRTRWEHGHLSVILSQGPRLLAGALRQRSLRLLVMWLELIVPPLSLLLMVAVGTVLILLVAGVLLSSWLPLQLMSTGMVVGTAGLFAAWWRFGRETLPLHQLLRVPQYVLSKLTIYKRFVSSPEQAWVRTAREPIAPAGDAVAAPHYKLSQVQQSRSSHVDHGVTES